MSDRIHRNSDRVCPSRLNDSPVSSSVSLVAGEGWNFRVFVKKGGHVTYRSVLKRRSYIM